MAQDQRIDALLREYDACLTTRNHYDNVRWTIATIFVAFSLAAFGLSFNVKITTPTNTAIAVVLLAVFSLLIFGISIAYFEHVQPYVRESLDRALQIEYALVAFGIPMQLQQNIIRKSPNRGRGQLILIFLSIIVLSFWVIRVLIAFVYGI